MSQEPQDAVICCIAINEELYLEEWIKYHLKLGFSHIYIYDNNKDQSQLTNYLENTTIYQNETFKKKVSILPMPGRNKQYVAYNHFLKHFALKHKWVSILDCDEFIVLKNWVPITQFLNQVCKQGSVSLHWRIFGDNGHKQYSPYPVTQRFTKCAKKLDTFLKSISVCNHIKEITDPHFTILHPPYVQHDCTGRKLFNTSLDESPKRQQLVEFAYINHYFGKSFEEWKLKKKRGCADRPLIYEDDYFKSRNINNVIDLSAHHFYTDPSLDFST